MNERLRMDVHADVYEFLADKFPDSIGTIPQWPRYDMMIQVNKGVSTAINEFFEAGNNGDLTGTAEGIVKTITALTGMAITLGIDLRPLWAAVHKARMSGTEADVGTLIALQDPLVPNDAPQIVT